MPLHRIYAVPGTFSPQDKAAISERLTAVYTRVGLPAFYVVVLFIEVPEDSFFIGGQPRKNFVRIVSQHLARTVPREQYPRSLDVLEEAWAPFIKDRGLDWEVHIEEHDRDLWRVQGLDAPLPGTDEEKLWARENRAIPLKPAKI